MTKVNNALLVTRWEGISQKLAALAHEIPDDKLDYRPTADVRTISEILRHAAYWNQYVAATLRGEPADDTANELPVTACPTKPAIIEALEQSAKETAAAMKGPQAAEKALPFIEHLCEHYGQLVVYSRMLGIVPPASRA